ncbi:glycerol-3-phosphate 1-O-acyltransferase PlsY [Alcanivorax hongdengensis]|uniref:glycerol-3-phosphate 1-O-acyltransferase PlsY n=1 Tax=Alcanivorax hongdengensis TaxID=519051 RepID=UPI0002EC7585|nr:glycerol-3-phosphate 1-O-acyltransferase PlsY [Alcanivorax hongdengensis]
MDAGTLQDVWYWLLPLCAAAYLGGSISSAILVCRLFGYPDPRTLGSNNPGATNVLRIGGKPAAALTLAGDVLKGVIPVLVAHALHMGPFIAALVGLFAFLGHLFPVFFQFQGGKGVATAFGMLFALHWLSGLVAGITWLAVFGLNRISSIASLSAFVVAPACIFVWLRPAFWPMVVLSVVMILRHRSNLQKLLRGEELGFKKKD